MMKKSNLILFRLAMCVVVFISSCDNDDDSTSKSEFICAEETISLEGAKLYLTTEGTQGSHNYRIYCISDGIYTNAGLQNGGSFNDYENATYFLAIKLAVPDTDEVGPGDFPQNLYWPEGSNASGIMMQSGEGDAQISCFTWDTYEDHSPVVVTGGVNDGNKMTLKFEGVIIYKYHNGTTWVEEPTPAKFYYTGTIQDKRDL